MSSRFWIIAALTLLGLAARQAAAEDPYRYWFLIHDRAVQAELKLSSAGQMAMRKEIDELDGRFMALRGAAQEKVAAELPDIIAEAKKRLHKVLKPEQERRLNEVVLRVQGPAALLRPDITAQMKFTADQKKNLETITGDAQKAIAELERKQREGTESAEVLQKEAIRLRSDEQADVFKLLTKPQQILWRKLAGDPFDASRLGQMAFKAPELTNTKVWLNSQPLTLAQLKGKVVALHFYTFG
jgi:hypothetical protein